MFLSKAKSDFSYQIVLRKFRNNKLWQEFSQELAENNKDYYDAVSVAPIFLRLNSEVEELSASISRSDAEEIEALCKNLSSLSQDADLGQHFDGVKVYVTAYGGDSLQTRRYQEPNLKTVNDLKDKMKQFLKKRRKK